MRQLEIERKYLLQSLPEFPATARSYRMDQGYFTNEPGRVRRTQAPDGTISYTPGCRVLQFPRAFSASAM